MMEDRPDCAQEESVEDERDPPPFDLATLNDSGPHDGARSYCANGSMNYLEMMGVPRSYATPLFTSVYLVHWLS